MPDLDPLPHRPGAPSFAPRPEDYAVVVGRARNRRRRQASAAGAGLAGVATVLALSVGGGGGSFGLRQVEPTNGGAAATASAPAAGSESPAPRPSESAGPEQQARPAEPDRQPGAEPSEPPDEQPDRAAAERPEERAPVPQPTRTGTAPRPPAVALDEVDDAAAAPCESDPSVLSAAGWCLRFDGPVTVRAGEAEPFRVFACRRLGRGSGELRFQTEQHVELVVTGENQREEWRWSAGYPFHKRANTVTVPEQRCARWTVTWDAEGSDGDYVRPGPYTMEMSITTGDYGDDMSGAVAAASWHEFDVTE